MVNLIQIHFENFSFLTHYVINASSSTSGLSGEIKGSLFPNFPSFLGHIIATIILLFVIIRYGYVPFRDSQYRKHEYIKSQIDNANKNLSDAKNKEKIAENLLSESKLQAQQIIDNAKSQALKKQNDILKVAKQKQGKMINDADLEIKLERNKMQNAIQTNIIETAFLIANKIVKKELKNKSNQQLIDDFLKDIDK